MDCSPPGSSIHGDSPGKNTEVIAISFSRGSSWPRDQICVCIGRWIFLPLNCHGNPNSLESFKIWPLFTSFLTTFCSHEVPPLAPHLYTSTPLKMHSCLEWFFHFLQLVPTHLQNSAQKIFSKMFSRFLNHPELILTNVYIILYLAFCLSSH